MIPTHEQAVTRARQIQFDRAQQTLQLRHTLNQQNAAILYHCALTTLRCFTGYDGRTPPRPHSPTSISRTTGNPTGEAQRYAHHLTSP